MPRTVSNNSCLTCRRRKVKCDERVPECKTCVRLNLYCNRQNSLSIKQYRPESGLHIDANGEPRELLQQEPVAKAFHVYITRLAAWYDLNDLECTFARTVAPLALQTPLLFSAAVAFGAIYLNKKSMFSLRYAEAYHTRCLDLLIALREDAAEVSNGAALASTCLLRSYELLAEAQDPNRHLFGASTLVPAVPALSDRSLLAGGFWNYLREDITYSLINRCPLKLDLSFSTLEPVRDDEHANAITLLLGRTVNQFFSDLPCNSLTEVEAWHGKFDTEPFCKIERDPFPMVKMFKECNVAAMHYYHVAKCMLVPEERISNAIAVCALAFSSDSNSVMVNAYGPIAFTAQWLKSGDQREALVRLLRQSGQDTAWPVERIIADLQKTWKECSLAI